MLERAGGVDVKGLRSNADGSWTGKASRNDIDLSVSVDSHSNIRER